MNKGLLTIFIGLAVSVFAFTTVAQAGETVISGFVDMSYFTNTNADAAADADASSFGMDQAEVDIEHTVNDKASLRFDLEHGDTGVAVEQGYITINAGAVTLTFGKFNAPIGFELLDAPDMYQYSHATVFDSGLPTNLTGAMISGGSGIIDYAVYVVNGWDNNTDDNTDKTIGARLGVTPMEGINIGFSYISGNETEVDADPDTPGDQEDSDPTLVGEKYNRQVIDIDFTYTRQENLTIGAEYNIGVEEKSSLVAGDTGDAKWTGFLVMAHYDFSDKYGITARYDSFDDQDGSRLGSKEVRNSITIAPTFAIAEGLGGLIEWKTTTSDQDVFKDKDDKDVDNKQTIAAELTFSF